MHIALVSRALRVGTLAIIPLAAIGCGGEDLDRYPISGTVTYGGQPVQMGAIFFEPTASVGKVAPTSYLRIENGKYDAGENGPVAGTYRVKITGWDPARSRVDDDGITHDEPLFPQYEFDVEIPPPDNRLDVDVPIQSSAEVN